MTLRDTYDETKARIAEEQGLEAATRWEQDVAAEIGTVHRNRTLIFAGIGCLIFGGLGLFLLVVFGPLVMSALSGTLQIK